MQITAYKSVDLNGNELHSLSTFLVMTEPYFLLDKNERTQQWVMYSLLAVFFLTLLIGLYTQSHNIDFDSFLVPLLAFSGGLYYLLNGLNLFGKGNLVLKHVPMGLPQLLQFVLVKWVSLSLQKAHKIAVISFGILSLLLGALLLSMGALVVIKG